MVVVVDFVSTLGITIVLFFGWKIDDD